MGITNMVATVPGFVVPAFVGGLTHGKVRGNYRLCDGENNLFLFQLGIAPWHIIFYTTAGLLFVEFIA